MELQRADEHLSDVDHWAGCEVYLGSDEDHFGGDY
jgi:hypothetical protein